MDRCALFVDAGYVLGDGALAVHGTRNRESVSWDYAGVLGVLKNVARDHTGLPLLRCYWYEATVEGRRSSDHETLANLPGVKLRLGKMKPGRREGVESEIHRDLTTLARNRAISDALVVSAEEDLAQVISDVQDLGLRVILVHIVAPGCTAAAALCQECDDIVEISEAHLRPSVELVVGAEPVSEDDRQPVTAYASRTATNGHGPPGVIGQPALPAGAHAAPPPIYTGSLIADYQRAAQPGRNGRSPLAEGAGPAAANHTLAGLPPGAPPGMAPPPGTAPPGMAPPLGTAPPPGAVSPQGGAATHPTAPGQPGLGQATPPGSRDLSGHPTLPTAVSQPRADQPAPPVGGQPLPGQPVTGQPAVGHPGPGQPTAGQPGGPSAPTSSAGPPAVPGQHAAVPGHHAAPGQHAGPGQRSAVPGHHAASSPSLMSGQPGATHNSGPLTASAHAQSTPRGGQHAGLPAGHPESAPAAPGQHAQSGLPRRQFSPGQPMPGQPASGQFAPGQLAPGQFAPGQPASGQLAPGRLAPGQPASGQLAPGQFAPGQPASGQFAPGQPAPGQFAPGQPASGQLAPGQLAPGQLAPGQPGAPGYQPAAELQGQPGPQSRQAMPAYQAAPPPLASPATPAPSAPLPPAPLPPAPLAPAAAVHGFSGHPGLADDQAPASPRPPTAGAPPGAALTAPPTAPSASGIPAVSAGRPGQQLRGLPSGYPAAPPVQPGLPDGGAMDQRAGLYPAMPGQPGGGPYVPQQGPHSGPQPVAQHTLVPQPVAVSLADAVQAAHGEGFNFGQDVARDAPALWLEAVLARKPRMPSDLEARLLQDSSLPIDSLLHDEVRHALRRGFWDALERVRH